LSLNHGTHVVTDVQVQSLGGQPGIGICRLRFSLTLRVPGVTDLNRRVQVTNLRATVLAGPEQGARKLLGIALPEMVLTVEQGSIAKEERFLMDLNLTPEQLNNLEEIRGGGGLLFELMLQCETQGQHGVLPAADNVLWNAHLSSWTSLLAGSPVLANWATVPGSALNSAATPAPLPSPG
jgi:hypothetical protein